MEICQRCRCSIEEALDKYGEAASLLHMNRGLQDVSRRWYLLRRQEDVSEMADDQARRKVVLD